MMKSLATIISIIAMVAIGYASKKIGILKAEDSTILNKIVVNIAIPSLIFLAMYTADISYIRLMVPIPLICILTGFICGALAYVFSKIKGYSKKTRWSIISATAMVNSGFLGYPVVLGVFGGEGLIRAIFYDMGTVILFISFGILFLLMFGGKYSTIAKRALIFPPLWGIILGISANFLNLNIGYVVSNILKYLSESAIPLIMISLGLSLEVRGIKGYFDAASFVTFIRLIASPIIAFTIVYILGMGGLERTVTIVEAAMPSAMLTLVLALTYDLDVDATAACIFLSTILSMISIPLVLVFL